MILGIDEVGRGPWAGPLVVGAVVLGGAQIEGLTDSKKLSKRQREALDKEIREKALGFGLGWVTAAGVDCMGLSFALKLATNMAVGQIKAPYDEIVIDGTVNFLAGTNEGLYVKTLKKADLLVPSVSAASIIAKVARDNHMVAQDELYPGYGFASHVGYGTAQHRAAIKKLGVTPIHRLSFAPLKKYAKSSSELDITSDIDAESSKSIGDRAEDLVAERLASDGHQVIDRNWKTKYCEIDIVSKKADILYFTEVKYRQHANCGDGLDVITKKKLGQMKFAAEFYVNSNDLSGCEMRLIGASVSGAPMVIDEIIEI